jgi:hypothetical protein
MNHGFRAIELQWIIYRAAQDLYTGPRYNYVGLYYLKKQYINHCNLIKKITA